MRVNKKLYRLHTAYNKHAWTYFCSVFNTKRDAYVPLYKCSCGGAYRLSNLVHAVGNPANINPDTDAWDCTSDMRNYPRACWGMLFEVAQKI